MTTLQLLRAPLARYEDVTKKIKATYPDATPDQIETMAAAAINKSLGL